jgi:hypothetical protein
MILHRIFGLIATAAFALGVVVQVKLLGSAHQADPFDPLLLTYAGLVVLAIGYLTLRAERKHGLIDPYDDSIDIIEIAYSQPAWARVMSFLLAVYTVVLYLVVYNATDPGLLTPLPQDSVLRESIPANGLGALFASLFLFSSFVVAAFLLFRKPIKEFH